MGSNLLSATKENYFNMRCNNTLAFLIGWLILEQIGHIVVHGIILTGKKEHLAFTKRLNDRPLRRFHQVSLEDCIRECDLRPYCASINYHRVRLSCELNGEADLLNPTSTRKQSGWVFWERNPREVTRPCGHEMCVGNQFCDIKTNSCRFGECNNAVNIPSHGMMFGNDNVVGARMLIQCDAGYAIKSNNTYHVTLTSECLVTGQWSVEEFDCVPATCWVRGQMPPSLLPGLYPYADDETSELIHIYCDFQTGFGYTFVSKEDFGKLSSLSAHYTRTDYVVLRHFRQDGTQKEANVSVLPLYSARYNVTILLNEATDFSNPSMSTLGPYVLVGFVPNRHGSKKNQRHGYLCNGLEISYNNCDNNNNNYLAIFSGTTPQGKDISPDYFDVGYAWVTFAMDVDSRRYLPNNFFGLFELGMGGCGAFMTSDYRRGDDTALGVAVGMRFDY